MNTDIVLTKYLFRASGTTDNPIQISSAPSSPPIQSRYPSSGASTPMASSEPAFSDSDDDIPLPLPQTSTQGLQTARTSSSYIHASLGVQPAFGFRV